MTLTFTDLEQAHRNFYVPAYRIRVNERDLLEQEFMEIASVQVDNTLKGADRFTFTVNSDFNFKNREFTFLFDLFAFGNPVEIRMGYQGDVPLPLMLRGKITSVQTSFPANGLPQITVSGYDLSYCMTIGTGKKPLKFPNKTDSEIVSEIARTPYGLNPKVKDTQVKHPLTEKGQQSDMQFLEKLAERNGYELYTFDQDLYFQPPSNDGDAVVSLEWGKGLLSFSPEINIAEQVTSVEVRGWDVSTKQEIVGTARQGEEIGRDSGRRSGGEEMQGVCRSTDGLKIRVPVFSRQEADRWAKAILKKRAEQFVQGSGESIGLPELRADSNIQLLGLGSKFSRTYYIEQTTHTINTSGYRTTFKVKDTTI
jgi:phage protein D